MDFSIDQAYFLDTVLWALREAGLVPEGRDSISPASLSRRYTVIAHARPIPVGPDAISSSIRISWKWSPLLSARFLTTEEDFLHTVFGEKLPDRQAEQPEIVLDVTLEGHAPRGAPVPDYSQLQAWRDDLAPRLAEHFPMVREGAEVDHLPHWYSTYHDEPLVRLKIADDGVRADGLSIRSRKYIFLPRYWDSEQEDDIPPLTEQLGELASAIKNAESVWYSSLAALFA